MTEGTKVILHRVGILFLSFLGSVLGAIFGA